MVRTVHYVNRTQPPGRVLRRSAVATLSSEDDPAAGFGFSVTPLPQDIEVFGLVVPLLAILAAPEQPRPAGRAPAPA